jgi:hypothetical protein
MKPLEDTTKRDDGSSTLEQKNTDKKETKPLKERAKSLINAEDNKSSTTDDKIRSDTKLPENTRDHDGSTSTLEPKDKEANNNNANTTTRDD